jgi:CRP/FNR family transcriptional regulator, dissimilatory nitrate respiration regulator
MSIEQPIDAAWLRRELGGNPVLQGIGQAAWDDLLPLVSVKVYKRGRTIVYPGESDLYQHFILHGIARCSIANEKGREVVLRFASEQDIDASYMAWRMNMSFPYTIRAVTTVQVASIPLRDWAGFLAKYPTVRGQFEIALMRLVEEMVIHHAHMHLSDGSARLQQAMDSNSQFIGRIPKQHLSAYLGLSTETLHRLLKKNALLTGECV